MNAATDALLDEDHDRFIAAYRAWLTDPTSVQRAACEWAYSRFYIRFNGSSVGLDRSMAELRRRMAAAQARDAA